HLVAIRNWNLITFVLKKSPFTFDEINRVNTFANAMDFDRVLPLYQRQHLPPFHHQLQDSTFYVAIETLLSPEKTTFEKAYPFRIYPVTENRPYFSQFLKLGRLSEIFPYLSNAMLPFLELGYILLIVTFLVVIVIALILILIPLFFHSSGKPHSRATFFYFAGLGLAYMFVEIVLIQRFVLYFGNPLYASSAVISGMLIFSGIGSYISSRLSTTRRNLIRIGMGIAFILLLCAGFLTPFLKATIHFSFGVKFVISLACLAPVCLLMGMPFPLGLRNLKDNNPDDIPWAWGINGCLSVISSVLASILCVEMGFLGVILLAAFIYGVVGWVKN
ncbi:MAG: hypothetical protein PHS99_09425, partial [Candidatus Marinimicrobia bacterium]|nr:hypothetical protein [Candidatus Neomarinimicrobiota bacterium]